MRLIDADLLIQDTIQEYARSKQYRAAFTRMVNKVPTIEPKRGEWVSKDPYWHTAICSNCNKVTMFEEWDEEVIEYDFCPNCGARMKGADDETD